MRVVVVREYTDKYTGEGHVIGEKLDMTEERFAEIQDKGMFVVDISDEVVQQETPAVSAEQVEDQEQETASEQTEPVEHEETSAPKQDKPANGGRRNSNGGRSASPRSGRK